MMILIKNIKQIVQISYNPMLKVCGKEMANIETLDNAYLIIGNGKIVDFGPMINLSRATNKFRNFAIRDIDARGGMVFPSFCDSHTHLVYADSREKEFVDKIKGLSYEEIAKLGGGILHSAERLHRTSEKELTEQALERLNEIMMLGTGAVEIKSGYGLTTEDELKMLRIIKKLKELSPLTIVSTFLGAHAVPSEYWGRQSDYVDLVINEMIPQVASEELADYIDVFCDRGFFTEEETDRMLMAGMKYGLRPKIHANELDYSGGVQVGVKYNALSVDHLECTGDDEIQALLPSETMPTVLPGAAFFLNMPHAPVRKMITAGLPVAFASDYNPGSSPSGNMQLVLSMACIMYGLTPEEAINATTINTAYAMGLSESHGSIAIGKTANLFITEPIPSYGFMPYAFGSNKVWKVILNGNVIS